MIVVCLYGVVTTTGIASGVDGKHHYQNSDAVNPGIGNHD